MKKILLVIVLFTLMNQAQAYEPSECDGLSIWKKSIKALGSLYFDPAQLTFASNNVKDGRCNS